MKPPITQSSDGEAPLWHDADGKYIGYEEVTAYLNRYAHITKAALDWNEGDKKKWMIVDQTYEGATLEEGIDKEIGS